MSFCKGHAPMCRRRHHLMHNRKCLQHRFELPHELTSLVRHQNRWWTEHLYPAITYQLCCGLCIGVLHQYGLDIHAEGAHDVGHCITHLICVPYVEKVSHQAFIESGWPGESCLRCNLRRTNSLANLTLKLFHRLNHFVFSTILHQHAGKLVVAHMPQSYMQNNVPKYSSSSC